MATTKLGIPQHVLKTIDIGVEGKQLLFYQGTISVRKWLNAMDEAQ